MCCPVCGSQWEREIDKGQLVPNSPKDENRQTDGVGKRYREEINRIGFAKFHHHYENTTLGWRPTCAHDADPVPATVFDPFVGSGTTVAVAQQLGRRGVGIDLSMPYLHLARERTGAKALTEWIEGKKNGKETGLEGLPLFEVRDEQE